MPPTNSDGGTLALRGIRHRWGTGGPIALNELTLTFTRGITGLLGPNGAGKTTFVRILCGELEPTSGAVLFNEQDLLRDRVLSRRAIGYVPQHFGFPPATTARELLLEFAAMMGLPSAKKRAEELLAATNLSFAADRYAADFSRGMKQRLGIALTLLHDPPVLVLDEPTAGLDPAERALFREVLAEAGRRKIVLLSTHIVGDVERCCERVVVLRKGTIAFDGTPSALAAVAAGKTWQVSATDPASVPRAGLVALRREGDVISARQVSPTAPAPDAAPLSPGIEDGYLLVMAGPSEPT
jgi:ABC-type multidrug transport system ATPase subunit